MALQTPDLTEEYVRPISRGQITIPAKYRRVYGIDSNTWLRLKPEEGRIVIYPARNKTDHAQKLKVIPPVVGRDQYLKNLKGVKGQFWTEEDEKFRLGGRRQAERKLEGYWKK